MRPTLITLAALWMAAAPANAAVGSGEYNAGYPDVLAAVHAPRLSDLADDAVRFSTTPQLGGRAWVVELHRQADGTALGEATFGFWARGGDWEQFGTLKLGLSAHQYAALTERIDELLDRGEPRELSPGESRRLVVCTDGPGYATERRVRGQTRWMSGDCGAHPNNTIAKLMLGTVWKEACLYRPTVAPCSSLPTKEDKR